MRYPSMAFMIILIMILLMRGAAASGTVANYLSNGWDIKAASQVSSTGRTQVILQKETDAVVCRIYFSVLNKGGFPKGAICFPSTTLAELVTGLRRAEPLAAVRTAAKPGASDVSDDEMTHGG
jgi:hypothetical protein